MILVDTHVVVWLAFDQSHLSENARAAIDDARLKGDGLAICEYYSAGAGCALEQRAYPTQRQPRILSA
jgi:hypothetical protein